MRVRGAHACVCVCGTEKKPHAEMLTLSPLAVIISTDCAAVPAASAATNTSTRADPMQAPPLLLGQNVLITSGAGDLDITIAKRYDV